MKKIRIFNWFNPASGNHLKSDCGNEVTILEPGEVAVKREDLEILFDHNKELDVTIKRASEAMNNVKQALKDQIDDYVRRRRMYPC